MKNPATHFIIVILVGQMENMVFGYLLKTLAELIVMRKILLILYLMERNIN